MNLKRTCLLGLVLPALGLSLLPAACDTSMEPSRLPTVQAFLNVPFSVAARQTAVLTDEHLSVTFVRVLDDSRCPIDANCIWSGDATISVRAQQEGRAAETLNLTLLGNLPGVVHEGFRFHAQQLMPGQVAGQTIRPEDYSVRLLVDRP